MRRIYLVVFINLIYAEIGNSIAILDSIINRLAPTTSKGTMIQINKYPDKQDRTFKYVYFSDNSKNAQLVKYISPKKVKNNTFLIKNDGKDIWAYFSRTRRVRKLASHLTKKGMQNSEFSFQDLGRNNEWLEDYNINIVRKDNDIRLTLRLKDGVDSEYTKIIIDADGSSYYPNEILYFSDGVNEKTLFLEDIRQRNDYIYATTMIMKNNRTKAETHMIIEEIVFDINFQNEMFNENKLKN